MPVEVLRIVVGGHLSFVHNRRHASPPFLRVGCSTNVINLSRSGKPPTAASQRYSPTHCSFRTGVRHPGCTLCCGYTYNTRVLRMSPNWRCLLPHLLIIKASPWVGTRATARKPTGPSSPCNTAVFLKYIDNINNMFQ